MIGRRTCTWGRIPGTAFSWPAARPPSRPVPVDLLLWCPQAEHHGKWRQPRLGRTTRSNPSVLGGAGLPWKMNGCHGHKCCSNSPRHYRLLGHHCIHPPDGIRRQHKPYQQPLHPQPSTHHLLGSHLCLVAADCPEGVHIKPPSVTFHWPPTNIWPFAFWTPRRTILKFISLANQSEVLVAFLSSSYS